MSENVDKRIEALEAQIATLQRKNDELERLTEPLRPRPAQSFHQQSSADRLMDNMLRGSTQEITRRMVEVVGDDLMKDIQRDNGIGRRR
jgi:hypothetical protein